MGYRQNIGSETIVEKFRLDEGSEYIINGDRCVYKGQNDKNHLFHHEKLNKIVTLSEVELIDLMKSNKIQQRGTQRLLLESKQK